MGGLTTDNKRLAEFFTDADILDIKANYVGIHFKDIPKDWDIKTAYIVSIMATASHECSD